MQRKDIKEMSLVEVEEFLAEKGWERYRARQVSSWVYEKRISQFEVMANLPLKLRNDLMSNAFVSSLTPFRVLISKDRTRKFLFQLQDEGFIETVLIPEKDHFTICLSTQLGCSLRCRFCNTGRLGLIRNLSCAEILNQLDAVLNDLEDPAGIKNIVVMGMGEPLANYEETLKALEIILHPFGYNFSHRRVTLSTAGLIPELRRLGSDNAVHLAISLNAADDKTRDFLMPINRRYPLEALLQACKEYPLPPRKRITFEYVLIAGVNDSVRDARNLADLLSHLRCKINLIPLNEHPGTEFKRPSSGQVEEFQAVLISRGFTVTIRESGGQDVMAACGQLGNSLTCGPRQ
jgi:23S rRNA (adenine2503-C2)-methyltransferase